MAFGNGHHLHLIDGSGFIFRAYHALPPLTRKSDGMPVGAVAGFCNMVHKMVEDAKGADAPTHVAVVFDHSSKTFRNDIYPEYKAQRPEPPEDLRPQFGLIREATRAFNLPCIEMEGYEADDIIATYAEQAREAGGRVTIISSDKDLMQMVGGGVEMFDIMKNRRIGPDEVEEKFGVGPDRVIDVQALAGDSVDNIPGAPGIGVKTAALLIHEYGDLENLLAHADEIKQPKRRQTLIDFADQIRVSRELVTLKRDTPVEDALESLEVREPVAEDLLGFLNAMEFRTLTARVASKLGVEAPVAAEVASGGASSPPEGGADGAARPAGPPIRVFPAIDRALYEVVRDRAALEAWVDRIREAGVVAVDTETTGLDEMRADLVGVSLCTGPGIACYVPVGHVGGEGDLFSETRRAEGQMPKEEALAILKPVLEDPSILKIGQNMKYDAKILARNGIDVAPIDDTMLVSYALHAGLHGHGMDYLSERYLGHVPLPIKALIGSGKGVKTFDLVPIEDAAPYAAEDAEVTWRLWATLKPRLPFGQVTRVYETLERPLVPVLAEMEMRGVKVDREHLSRMSGAFAQKMAALEEEIHGLAGGKFNIGSPKQLGEVLFDRMSIAGGKKGKTGAYATGADVLEELAAQGHDLPARVLDWRQLSKLKSTYTDALQDHIHPETGRVHTSLFDLGGGDGADRLDRSEPSEHPDPDRGGAAHPRGVHRGRGQRSGVARLQPDRASDPRACRGHQGAEGGVPRRARHPCDDGLRDVRGADRGNGPVGAAAGQGDQFRGDLRHLGLWTGQQPAHPARGRQAVHRHVFRAVSGHPRLHGPDRRLREGERLRRDAVRAADAYARDRGEGAARGFRRSGGDQRADPGRGGGHHPAGDDPGARRDRGPAGADAAPGA